MPRGIPKNPEAAVAKRRESMAKRRIAKQVLRNRSGNGEIKPARQARIFLVVGNRKIAWKDALSIAEIVKAMKK